MGVDGFDTRLVVRIQHGCGGAVRRRVRDLVRIDQQHRVVIGIRCGRTDSECGGRNRECCRGGRCDGNSHRDSSGLKRGSSVGYQGFSDSTGIATPTAPSVTPVPPGPATHVAGGARAVQQLHARRRHWDRCVDGRVVADVRGLCSVSANHRAGQNRCRERNLGYRSHAVSLPVDPAVDAHQGTPSASREVDFVGCACPGLEPAAPQAGSAAEQHPPQQVHRDGRRPLADVGTVAGQPQRSCLRRPAAQASR